MYERSLCEKCLYMRPYRAAVPAVARAVLGGVSFVAGKNARYARIGKLYVIKHALRPVGACYSVKKRKGNAWKQDIKIPCNLFRRMNKQRCSYLLGNGVTLRDEALKRSLGSGFDLQLQRIRERALLQGVCWGFWNADHVEMIELCRDALSGFLPLCDELTGELRAGVQF